MLIYFHIFWYIFNIYFDIFSYILIYVWYILIYLFIYVDIFWLVTSSLRLAPAAVAKPSPLSSSYFSFGHPSHFDRFPIFFDLFDFRLILSSLFVYGFFLIFHASSLDCSHWFPAASDPVHTILQPLFRLSYTPSDFNCPSSMLDTAMAWY